MSTVRALLRKEPRYADMSRYQLDTYLGDLERELYCSLNRVIESEVREALIWAETDEDDDA
jgi:hypothetical protein